MTFWVKPAIVDCILRPVVVICDVSKLEELTESVSEEKSMISGEFSLVERVFDFLLFPMTCTRDPITDKPVPRTAGAG